MTDTNGHIRNEWTSERKKQYEYVQVRRVFLESCPSCVSNVNVSIHFTFLALYTLKYRGKGNLQLNWKRKNEKRHIKLTPGTTDINTNTNLLKYISVTSTTMHQL